MNVSSLALPPIVSQSVSQSVRPSVTKLATPSRKKARSQNSPPHPKKRPGHKTRDPIPRKGSVTKLATPEKRLGHKTRDPIPKKGPVTKLATSSRKKARSQRARTRTPTYASARTAPNPSVQQRSARVQAAPGSVGPPRAAAHRSAPLSVLLTSRAC